MSEAFDFKRIEINDDEAGRTRKVALITGITGQDGSYLYVHLQHLQHSSSKFYRSTEFLLGKGYTVHGIIRRSSSFNTGRPEHMFGEEKRPDLLLHYGDMSDPTSLVHIISRVQPTEVYNLAAQSHVLVSFSMPSYTADVDAVGTLRLPDAIRTCGMEKSVRFYQASTSELFGQVTNGKPQDENTPFSPRSPYGVAKLYAHWITRNYRESYDIFACNGILFNHESPRRGRTFVSRKISRAVADIKAGRQQVLLLGNLDAQRDWGHARDFVRAMWLMLQRDKPKDYVISTGTPRTVREFVVSAFEVIGWTISWHGDGLSEVGLVDGVIRVKVDSRYFRPAEVDWLCGNSDLARKELGWVPETSFAELVKEMVSTDMQTLH